jgi:hypothetical protein
MFRKKSTLRAILSFAAVFILSFSVVADTIRLKDGSIIKGTIVNFADGRFTVSIGEGARRRELTLSAEEIASIEFDSRPLSNGTSTRNSQPAGDSKIVPVSTKTSPKVEITDNVKKPADADSSDNAKPAPKVTITDNVKTQQPTQTRNIPSNTTATKPVVKPPPVSVPSSTASAKAVTFNVRVLADNTANGWTNSGFVVKRGQRIRITGGGSVSLGKGHTTTASGLPDLEDPTKLLKSVPTGALLAVIGDDNNDFIYIGESREFTAGRDGALYLGVNEGNLSDNSGAFDVKIEVLSDN